MFHARLVEKHPGSSGMLIPGKVHKDSYDLHLLTSVVAFPNGDTIM